MPDRFEHFSGEMFLWHGDHRVVRMLDSCFVLTGSAKIEAVSGRVSFARLSEGQARSSLNIMVESVEYDHKGYVRAERECGKRGSICHPEC